MQPAPFPAIIYQYANTYQLGVPLKVYRGHPTGCLYHLLWIMLMFVGGGIMTGNIAEDPPDFLGGFGGAALFLSGVLICFVVAVWPALHVYYACSQGFFGIRGGRVIMALRWNDILRATKTRSSVNYIPVSTIYKVATRQRKSYTVYSLALFDQK
jgi:hypothetical protein